MSLNFFQLFRGVVTHEEGFPIHSTLRTIAEFFGLHAEAFFELSSPHDVIPFKQTVQPMLPEFYKVEFADNYIHEILSALNMIERATVTSSFLIIGASVLIISLSIIMFLRNRLLEIGLYMSAGERKVSIAFQIFLEKIIIFSSAIVIPIIAGRIIMRLFSENVIINQLKAYIEEEYQSAFTFSLFEIFGFRNTSDLNSLFLMNYYTNISIEDFILFFVITLGIILTVTAIVLVYILRLPPKKIMMH